MQLTFKKMQSLGNDFIVINNIDGSIKLSKTDIHKLSDRHFGIGCDQLLILERSNQQDCDFHYRIFNVDGKEVGQCGNGARCIAKFINDEKLSTKKHIKLSTNTTRLELHINDDQTISVNMNTPQFEPDTIPINHERADIYHVTIDNKPISFYALSMGNPHATILCDDIDQIAIDAVGKALNQHKLFPEGVNVGFMQIVDNKQIKLRVYERGVGETLACGSGSCAAVAAGIQHHLLDSEVNVYLSGGKLLISWQGKQNPVWMTGPAEHVFDGIVAL